MNELTQEKALQNIKILIDNFVGTKQQHLILEQSYDLILKQLTPIDAK